MKHLNARTKICHFNSWNGASSLCSKCSLPELMLNEHTGFYKSFQASIEKSLRTFKTQVYIIVLTAQIDVQLNQTKIVVTEQCGIYSQIIIFHLTKKLYRKIRLNASQNVFLTAVLTFRLFFREAIAFAA